MNARYYVGGIGRFANADSIIPNPTNPQTFNRYSYVNNQVLNLVDPSGHCGADVDSNGNRDQGLFEKCEALAGKIEYNYGIKVVWDNSDKDSLWTFEELQVSSQKLRVA